MVEVGQRNHEREVLEGLLKAFPVTLATPGLQDDEEEMKDEGSKHQEDGESTPVRMQRP